jgi:transcription elongation GreA/GreB family factor
MKLLIPVAATLVFAGASVAYAADVTSKIKSIDAQKDMVTLDNGSSYLAPSTVKLSNFKVGEKVVVNYTANQKKMEINTIRPAA